MRFTSRPFLELSFALFEPITSLNAASPAARNKEQVNITKILSTVGFNPQHDTASRLPIHHFYHTAKTRLIWMKELNVYPMFIYTIYK